jgi:hypothetical protein
MQLLLLLTFLFSKNMRQSCITEDFVPSLAQLLNTAQVPCVLWGHVLLRTHGVPTIVGVSVPSRVLLEAFMRFCARYVNTPAGGFSISMIAYVGLYIDDDGYLDLKQLSEPLSSSYLALREGKIPVRQWVNELKKLLGEPGLLT